MKKFTYLKESPIFQLSLTSKELYHSNFIYWIVSNYKEEFSKLISKLIPNIKVITDIKREEKNKDIVIYFKDSNGKEMKVILENKVKSIPTYEQLLKYTTQDISESYILLSLARPTFVSKDNKIKIKELDREWIYLDYARLASMLEEILTEVYSKNTYHFLILSDYIQVIKELDNIKNEIYNNIEYGVYDLYKKENQLVCVWQNKSAELCKGKMQSPALNFCA